jgi:hypothetical protein
VFIALNSWVINFFIFGGFETVDACESSQQIPFHLIALNDEGPWHHSFPSAEATRHLARLRGSC